MNVYIYIYIHHQRKILHTAGASFNPVETARLIQLTVEVMQRHYTQSSLHYTCRITEKNIEDSSRFLQTFGTLKVQSFILTEVSDCGLLIVVTSSTFLKRKDILKEKTS